MTHLPFHDGHRIPQLALDFGKSRTTTAPVIVSMAARAGYRLFDGAAIYGNEQGLGQGIRDSGLPRADLFVTTKVLETATMDLTRRLPRSMRVLRVLGLDRLDLVLIHWPCRERIFTSTLGVRLSVCATRAHHINRRVKLQCVPDRPFDRRDGRDPGSEPD